MIEDKTGILQKNSEDGRNVISVIINAISVRVNMPRGTLRALLACFAALVVIAGLVFAGSLDQDKAGDEAEVAEQTEAVAQETDNASEPEESDTSAAASNDAAARDGAVALKDYINISAHYYYHLPENVEEIWQPDADECLAENETICNFTYNGDLYTIRSYVLEYSDQDLADLVKAHLSIFDSMSFADEGYIDGKYGDMLRIRFESTDETGAYVAGTGYYWYESVPKICCLEVSSDARRDDAAEELVKDSVYRVSAGTTPPYTIDADTWGEIQKQEAMDSIAEDAWREYNEPEPDPYDGRVLKP